MPTTKPDKKKPGKSKNKSKSGALPAGPDQWPEWVDHLAQRKRPRALRNVIDTGRGSALEWPLHGEFPESTSAELLAYLERLKLPQARGNGELARRLEGWLDEAPQRAPSALFAIECLGWAHAMPHLAQWLPAAPWCQLLDQLLSVCRDAAGIAVTDDPLAQQILYGELPLTLAYQFPELEACASLADSARRALSDGILEMLDGEGLINSRHHAAMRPLLACWTRCVCLAGAAGTPCFNDVAHDQYEWLVRESMRLCRHDGSQVLSRDDSGRWEASLFETALKQVAGRKNVAIANLALPTEMHVAVASSKSKDAKQKHAKKKHAKKKEARKKSKAKALRGPKLPEATVHSEWAGTALLRPSWSRDAETLALAYHDQELALELNCGSQTLWSGPWGFEVEVDGKTLDVTDQWEEVCWVCDKDVSYVEVEAKLSDGWRLQRQLLLGRDDQFLFVADALLGNKAAGIKYQTTLPLAEGIRFQPADETREGTLASRRGVARVLPLNLPEWRLPAQGGALEQTERGLVLTQEADGYRMFAPLFFDLNPRRLKKALTWRKLTVGQQLEIAPADEAAGYRVQVGSQQWLFFRSLGPTANRTVLGQNYSAEFVAARFPVAGEAEKLIEIE